MRPTRPLKLPLPAFLAAAVSASFTLPVTAELAAALLPSSRSAEVGNTVTVFSTVINPGTETATGCQIGQQSGLPLSVGYQTTDPATNLPVGVPNTPVDIAAGQAQSFVLSVTPMALIDSTEVEFSFTCASGENATTFAGVNTLLLSASDTPVVDVVALSATAQNTGVLSLDESIGAFALATINLGAADTVTVVADTGSVELPVSLSVCETNTATGACLAPPAASVESNIAAGGTPTFSVFSSATGTIANNPAVNRVFVRFLDSSSIVRGGTSVAVENQIIASVADGLSAVAESIQSVLAQGLGVGFLGADGTTDGQTIDSVISCEIGQLAVSGAISVAESATTLDADLNFQNCDGMDGLVSISSTMVFDDNIVALDFTQNGSYSTPECTQVTVDELRIAGSFDLASDLALDAGGLELTTSGGITGVCNGDAFSCSLEDLDLDDEESFANSCSI